MINKALLSKRDDVCIQIYQDCKVVLYNCAAGHSHLLKSVAIVPTFQQQHSCIIPAHEHEQKAFKCKLEKRIRPPNNVLVVICPPAVVANTKRYSGNVTERIKSL